MHININSTTGFYAARTGSEGVHIEGVKANEYPFNLRWDDLQGTIHGQTGTGTADLTYETYRDTGFNIYFFRHNQDDQLNIIYQMPHSWDPSTTVYPHIHVLSMASPATTEVVLMEVSYSWANKNSVLPASSGWFGHTIEFQISASMLYQHKSMQLTSGGLTPPSGASSSTMLLIKTKRLGTNPSDTFTTSKDHGTAMANLGVLYSDLHFQKVVAGTLDQSGYVY